MSRLGIAEQFYSIQGEGPHAGTPAVFLRLAGCNLVCGGRENATRDPEKFQPEGDATWVCDTIDVWREADRLVEPSEAVEDWEARGWLEALSDGAHLVLTGGEPLLEHNQEAIIKLHEELASEGIDPYVEVETNGTIKPETEFWPLVDQYNVSLKLSNSGMEYGERVWSEAIQFFKTVHETGRDEDGYGARARFKFVVSSESDVDEIMHLVEDFSLPDSMISLMPAGQTQEQLRGTYPSVAEICKQEGWKFSPRLQVDTWNQATGV